MLECHVCLTRCLRALLSTPPRANAPRLGHAINRKLQSSRNVQSQAAVKWQPSRIKDADIPSSNEPTRQNGVSYSNRIVFTNDGGQKRPQTWSDSVGINTGRMQRDVGKATRLTPQERDPQGKRLNEWKLQAELKYLKDPVKLADHVQYVLQSNDHEKALALCCLSSNKMANTVSWNHLIDWQMRNGKTNAALDTFNQMKKRKQKPDSYTYVLLLRGLADYAHHPNSLGKALSLYHGMQGPNAAFPPNIIHVNAVLKVCARANDMDSLWDIASNLPERGPHSANSWTFTTILNYMRANVLAEIKDDPGSDVSLRRIEEVVMKGKQLWSVILARWRGGELMIDEHLVCAMGRLLLTGSRPRDWDNVLSLVQQTMNITRLEPRLGTLAREQSRAPKIRAPYTPEDLKDDGRSITLNIGEESEDDLFNALDVQPSTRHAEGSVSSQNRRGRGLFAFASPGRSTLSLILDACLKTIIKQAATGYWELLTDPNGPYRIHPDSDNIHMLLRNLRRANASTEAMQVIEDLPRLNVHPSGTTYWLAMTACQKDAKNPDAIENGKRVLDSMQRTLAIPNIMTMSIFLNLARQTKDFSNVNMAVQRLWPSVTGLRSALNYESPAEIAASTDSVAKGGKESTTSTTGKSSAVKEEDSVTTQESSATKISQATDMFRKEATGLFNNIIDAYDYLLHRSNADLGSLRQTYMHRRMSLAAHVNRRGSRTQFGNAIYDPRGRISPGDGVGRRKSVVRLNKA